MQLLLGLALLIGGIGALLVMRPRDGTPRSFVGTSMEVPIVIAIVLAIGAGVVLSVGGVFGAVLG
jgi:hypothetical protein